MNKSIIAEALKVDLIATNHAISLAGALNVPGYTDGFARVRKHETAFALAAGGRATWGQLEHNDGIEVTLVDHVRWGWGTYANFRPVPTEYWQCNSDYNGTYISFPFQHKGVWYCYRLSTTARHDYIAVLDVHAGEIVAWPLGAIGAVLAAMPGMAEQAEAVEKEWFDAGESDHSEELDPPVPTARDLSDSVQQSAVAACREMVYEQAFMSHGVARLLHLGRLFGTPKQDPEADFADTPEGRAAISAHELAQDINADGYADDEAYFGTGTLAKLRDLDFSDDD